MSPDTDAVATTQRALALWNEVAAAYDAIERRLASGTWDGFEEVVAHVAGLEQELQPLLATIATERADASRATDEIRELWQELDRMMEALARRQALLERAAVGARDTTAARLVRTRIARARATGYAPLNPLTPQFTSKRV